MTLVAILSVSSFAKNERVTRAQKKKIKQLEQFSWNYIQLEMYEQNEVLLKRLEKRMANDQIIGLELIIAASTSLRFESKWGHTMLRFVDNVRTSNNDITLGFIADLDNHKTNYLKGAVGAYPVFPILKSLGDFNEQYIKGEDRSLERHIIPTTKPMIVKMIKRLRKIWNEMKLKNEKSLIKQAKKLKKKVIRLSKKKKHAELELSEIKELGYTIGYTFNGLINGAEHAKLYSLEIKPKKSKALGGYTFTKNNCAGALIKFFKESSFNFIGKLRWNGRVPIRQDDFLDHYYLSSYGKTTIPAITKFKSKLEQLTSKTYIELNDFENWSQINIDTLIDQLSAREVMLLLDQENLGIPPIMLDRAIERVQLLTNKPNYDELYQISTLPEILYKACQTKPCAKEQISQAKRVFSLKDLKIKISTKKRIKKKHKKKAFVKSLMNYQKILKQLLK